MALSASSVFEVQTGGSDTNGGGFVTGAAGTDYSLVAGKRVATGADDSTTDAVAVGTTAITSATAVFGTTIVGNIIYLQGGTGTLAAGWYQVASRTNATTIAVDRNVAAGTGITMNVGGALASPGMAGGVGLVSGNTIYTKAGTYSVTSATVNIAAGCPSFGTTRVVWEGYQTTRGDLGTPPLLQASGISTATLVTTGTGDAQIRNINVDGAGLTSLRGFNVGRCFVFKCGALNCTNTGFTTANTLVHRCYATGCSGVAAFTATTAGTLNSCIAYDNTIVGFSLALVSATNCIADTNTGAASDGFSMVTGLVVLRNCVAYANGRHGFRFVSAVTSAITNCVAESNGGFGYVTGTATDNSTRSYCASYNNTSGETSGTFFMDIGNVTGSGSFFTNAASQDFSLNNTAGAGAALRATGYPGILPVGGTGYQDIGSLQHADPASSGSGGYGAAIFGG